MRKFENSLWIVFLVWTVIGVIVLPLGLGEADITTRNEGLRGALVYILNIFDPVWFVLAASVVYVFVLQDAAAMARIWAGILVISSGILMTVGAVTGYPFGSYAYTSNIGYKLFGTLPFTVPLLFWTVLIAARYLILKWNPRASRLQIAAGGAFIALLTDLNLEFVAWKARAYWIWYPPGSPLATDPPGWPPVQNYISWFLFSFLILLVLPQVRMTPRRDPIRVILVLAAMNALFLLVHATWLARFGGY